MKETTLSHGRFTNVEFWVATSIFIVALIFFIAPSIDGEVSRLYAPNKASFEHAGVSFNYYQHYLIPTLIRFGCYFLAFSLLSFRLLPNLLDKEKWRTALVWIILILIGVFLINMLTSLYLKRYLFFGRMSMKAAYNTLWQQTFVYTLGLVLLFAAYSILKYGGIALYHRIAAKASKSKYVSREWQLLALVWITGALFFAMLNAPEIVLFWLASVPSAVVLYRLSFKILIPSAYKKRRPLLMYFLYVAPLAFALFVIVVIVLIGITDNGDMSSGIAAGNAFFQFLLVAPGVWILFRHRMKDSEELFALKTELGRSTANLDFLRSQINPHFLFNALNTIYGTAIQEGAERTSEGVQKLGDMMRFMLQENVQEKISITREIDYLNNYISLQRLRTDGSAGIRIQVDIQPEISPLVQIAPMLLIPFIENAFKHGISLREESHIKISLEVKGHMLYFDVYNTKHLRPQHDPEKDSNGIGLVNVKQRLQLLYPNRHELMIRETAKDFFVHLMVNLEK